MLLKETGLTAQDIKDKVNKYMIETYERFDFVAETAKDVHILSKRRHPAIQTAESHLHLLSDGRQQSGKRHELLQYLQIGRAHV